MEWREISYEGVKKGGRKEDKNEWLKEGRKAVRQTGRHQGMEQERKELINEE